MSTPIDAAFSVLKPEEEVRKIFPVAAALPYVIPAAAAIYGGIQGAKNVRENKVTDPVLGTELAEGDDSFLSNLGEFGTGLAQGFVPGVGAKAGARYAGKKALAAGAAKQAPKKVAAKRSADKARAAQQQRMSARAQRDELNRLHTTPMVQGSRGQRLHQQRMADLNRQVASNRPELQVLLQVEVLLTQVIKSDKVLMACLQQAAEAQVWVAEAQVWAVSNTNKVSLVLVNSRAVSKGLIT